jgi:abortive infection bacteriophage resistance protein
MTAPPAIPFLKPWLRYADQIALLESRGLVVSDRVAAEQYLTHLNYYRLSGYCLAFESSRHVFIPGTTFEQVYRSYEFDLTLRDLLTEALEVIEVDFRANIAYKFGQQHGAFCHVTAGNYHHKFYQPDRVGVIAHSELMEKLRKEAERSSELFVIHFRNKHKEFPDLPIWMATEIASFGCISRMFSGMRDTTRGNIANRYALQIATLEKLIHHFSYVRNLCAHHARLWDRQWAIRPTLPAGKDWQPPNSVDNSRLFATLLLLCRTLKRIQAVAPFLQEWKRRVESHLANSPEVPNALQRMGITSADWKSHPVWA